MNTILSRRHRRKQSGVRKTGGTPDQATGPLSDAYALMGAWYEDEERYVHAADFYRRGFDLDQTSEDPSGQVRAKRRLARIFRKRGDSSRARELIEEARDLLPADDDVSRAALLQEEAELWLSGSEPNYLKAITRLEEALEIATADGDERVIAIAKRNLARAYREDDDLERAMTLLNEARGALEARGDLRELDDLLDDLGEVLIESGYPDRALEPLQESLELDERLQRIGSKGRSLLLLGRAHSRMGDADAAGRHFNEALELYASARHEVGLAEALHWVADWHIEQRQLNKAIPLLRQAIEIENHLNRSPLGRVRAKRLLAQAYRERGDLRRAGEYLAEARNDLGRIDDPDEQAWLDLEAGRLAFAEGRFREAGELLRAAKRTLRQSGSSVDVATCDRCLGLAAAYEGHYTEALAMLDSALDVLQSRTDIPELDELYDDLGEVHLLRQDLASARENVERSLEVGASAEWRHGKGRSHVLMARISMAQGEFEEARRHLESAIDAYDVLNDNVGKADALLAFGDWYADPQHRSRDLVEAVLRYKEARRLEHAHQDPRGVTRCNRKLAHIYTERHEYDRAQEALDDATASMQGVRDSRERAPLDFEHGRLAAARQDYPDAVSHLKSAIRGFKELGQANERRAASHLLVSCYQAQGKTAAALEAIRDLESESAAMYNVLVKDLHPRVAAAGLPNFEHGRYTDAIINVFRELEEQVKKLSASLDGGPAPTEGVAVHIKALADNSSRDDFGMPKQVSVKRFWDLCTGSFELLRNPAVHEGRDYTPSDAFAALSIAHLIARTLDQRVDR